LLFASATSNFPATAIAEGMRRPERLVIGHPFNPPHLVPLVEVVPGARTDPAVAERAVAFYRAMGKRPQLVKKEIPGFVANRLQAALFREAIHLVREGVVTEQELDDIVTSSIGMRWAIAGPFQTFHLGGGPGGLPAFLEHLGKSLEEVSWPLLGAPSLDEATVAVLNEQAQHFGATVDQLAANRDEAIVRLLRALRQTPTQANE
jgi:ketoreductase RED1